MLIKKAIALNVAILILSVPQAYAAMPNDLCSRAGTVERDGGQRIICDGISWLRVIDINHDGSIGIRTNSPRAPLHVNGEIIVGEDPSLVCDSAHAGALRWNGTDKAMEFCNGTFWSHIGDGAQ